MAGFPKNIEFVLVFVFAVFNSSFVFVQSACVFERKGLRCSYRIRLECGAAAVWAEAIQPSHWSTIVICIRNTDSVFLYAFGFDLISAFVFAGICICICWNVDSCS